MSETIMTMWATLQLMVIMAVILIALWRTMHDVMKESEAGSQRFGGWIRERLTRK